MFIKIYEPGWEESGTQEVHYHIINTKDVVEVVPVLECVDEDEYGLEISEELKECEVILRNGHRVSANMTATVFANKYLDMSDDAAGASSD